MLKCDALLNLIELGSDPWVIFVAIGVKSSKCPQTFVWSVVIDEPLKQLLVSVLEGNRGDLHVAIPGRA
jgi:hypothetical protein